MLQKHSSSIRGKPHSQIDRLNVFMFEKRHDVESNIKIEAHQLFCPFQCDSSPFHTVTLLLGHCQSVHDDSLGKYNKGKVNNILSALVYSINGSVSMAHYQWLTTNGSLPMAHYQWLTTNGSLPMAHYQWFTTNDSLPMAHTNGSLAWAWSL